MYKGNKKELPSLPKKRKKNLKNKPSYDLRTHLCNLCGVDLTDIDGIDTLTAQKVISEIGLNMGKWQTVKHFTSWLGLCPYNQIKCQDSQYFLMKKILILGDVHSIYPALKAVAQYVRKERFDRIVNTGDLTVYSTFPMKRFSGFEKAKKLFPYWEIPLDAF